MSSFETIRKMPVHSHRFRLLVPLGFVVEQVARHRFTARPLRNIPVHFYGEGRTPRRACKSYMSELVVQLQLSTEATEREHHAHIATSILEIIRPIRRLR